MERRNLTLMFTDIVGYSKLMGQNEAQTIELLGEYRRILLAQIAAKNGQVIEFIGDAVFARFDTPFAAVRAGVDIQKDLAAFNREKDPSLPCLQTRIGIHAGEVTVKDDALFGDDVNIAARLEPIAVAEGLCISAQVYKAVKEELDEPVLALGVQPLKNIKSQVRAYLVRPSGITLGVHLHYWLRKLNQKLHRYRYPLAVCVLALFVAGYYFIPRWLVPGYTANYVEIADFKNLMSETGEADYFSAGITEALRAQLADIDDVYILEADKGIRGPIRLEGSVQRVGDSLRIAYRLFRRKDNVQIAGGKLDGAYKDIFILQDRVVAEIAGYLAKEFKLPGFRPAALGLTSDVTAYDYYLQGLEYLKKPLSDENNNLAIKLFSTALIHDSEFEEALVGMCKAYSNKFLLTRASDLLALAEEKCERSIEIDDGNIDAYVALSNVYRMSGRIEEALDHVSSALKIESDNVDVLIEKTKALRILSRHEDVRKIFSGILQRDHKNWMVYQEYGAYLLEVGGFDQAIDYYRQALKITPENSIALNDLGVAYHYLGHYENAAKFFEKSLEISPNSEGFSNVGTLYYYMNNFQRSVEMFEDAVRLSPEDYRFHTHLADALRQLGGDDVFLSNRHYKIAIALGEKTLAENGPSYDAYAYLAMSHLYLHEIDKAKEYLDLAVGSKASDVEVLLDQLIFWSVLGEYSKAVEYLDALLQIGYSPDSIRVDPDLKKLITNREAELVLQRYVKR